MKLDAYVVLIQDKLMEQINATINHTRHEGDNCADFMAKFGASLNIWWNIKQLLCPKTSEHVQLF